MSSTGETRSSSRSVDKGKDEFVHASNVRVSISNQLTNRIKNIILVFSILVAITITVYTLFIEEDCTTRPWWITGMGITSNILALLISLVIYRQNTTSVFPVI